MGRQSQRWALSILASAAAVAAGLAQVGAQVTPSTQVPVYRSGVELISVDVNVLDKTGAPIRGLRPDQFEVTVDGKPRRVVSAESVEFVTPATDPSEDPAPIAARGFTTNDTPVAAAAPGRLVFLVVDQGSFKPLDARAATAAARRFIDRLQPQDRVGLITFPPPGPSLAPSTEHAVVSDALTTLVGSADPSLSSRAVRKVSLSESLDIEARDDAATDNIVARECRGVGGANLKQCSDEVVMQAHIVATVADMQAVRTLSSLQAAVRALGRIPERKVLVLLSAGMPSADRTGGGLETRAEIASIGRLAAAANASIYVLHVDHHFLDAFGASESWVSSTISRDETILRHGLETMASSSGGTLFSVVNAADPAFERVLKETAAAYVLGVEPMDLDRDGQPHAIKVGVKVPGVQIRSRREFVMAPEASPSDTAERRLTSALAAQRLAIDLPLGVSVHTLGQAASGEVRVLITARVGRGLAAPLDTHIAYLLTDPSGRSIGSASEARRLPVAHASVVGAASYVTAVGVKPGDYLLRLAVVDGLGRVGSVEHWFSASLANGDGIRMSDLLLLDPTAPTEEDLSPVADGRLRTRALDAYMEVYPRRDGMPPPEATFSIASAPNGTPLLRTSATVNPNDGGRSFILEALLDIRRLPPGDYVAELAVTDGQRVIGRRFKRISVEGPEAGASR